MPKLFFYMGQLFPMTKNILIVEDDPGIRQLLQLNLSMSVKWTPNLRQLFKWDTVQRNG